MIETMFRLSRCIFCVVIFTLGCKNRMDSDQDALLPPPEGITAHLQVVSIDGRSVKVQVSFHNARDVSVKVDEMVLLPDGELFAPAFRVTHDGREVPYIGELMSRIELRPEDYYDLQSGETYVSQVDLARFYDLSRKGAYTVRYQDTWFIPHDKGEQDGLYDLVSNTADFRLDKGIAVSQKR